MVSPAINCLETAQPSWSTSEILTYGILKKDLLYLTCLSTEVYNFIILGLSSHSRGIYVGVYFVYIYIPRAIYLSPWNDFFYQAPLGGFGILVDL